MQEKVFTLLTDEKEITWQTVLKEMVKSEQMDPWDIDINLLGQKYREKIEDLQEHNFFVSGKVVLASAFLLKLKSHIFLTEYIPNFDSQLFPIEEVFDDLQEAEEERFYQHHDIPPLLIKTPQARKRKISLNELIKALEMALDVDNRRFLRRRDEEFIRMAVLPGIKLNITNLILDLYDRIKIMFRRKEQVTFNKLVSSQSKEDKINTFLPLLHLQNQDKIDLDQQVPFGEIYIKEIS